MSQIVTLGEPVANLIIRSIAVYLIFLIALRIFGKRELGQFTPFDLVLMLLVANALQPAITGSDNSITGGIIIILTLFVTDQVLDRVLFKAPRLRRFLEGEPVLIAENGHWIEYSLEKEGIDVAERGRIIRKQGYEDVSQIKRALLETDGSISIFPIRGGGSD